MRLTSAREDARGVRRNSGERTEPPETCSEGSVRVIAATSGVYLTAAPGASGVVWSPCWMLSVSGPAVSPASALSLALSGPD